MTDREEIVSQWLESALRALCGARDLIESVDGAMLKAALYGDFKYATLTNGMRCINEDRMRQLNSAILMLTNRPWRTYPPTSAAIWECHKCGATDLGVTYNPGVRKYHGRPESELKDPLRCHDYGRVGHHRADEHLDKLCRSCRYEWEEDCLIQGEGR